VKVILFGATGMVGQGILREYLLDPELESVLAIGRNNTGQQHEKLHEIVHKAFRIFPRPRAGSRTTMHAFSALASPQ
jgi:hypothetical protein